MKGVMKNKRSVQEELIHELDNGFEAVHLGDAEPSTTQSASH